MNYRTAAHEAIGKAGRFWGYVPDADHKRRQKDSSLRFGAAPAVPAQASLARFRGSLFDQGLCRSCTGHGTAQAVFTSAKASGNALPFMPSPKSLYSLARILERSDASQKLTDSGAMPSDLLTVLRQYGVSPIQAPTSDGRYSDVEPSNVNDEPSLLDLETAGLKLLTGEYRVDESRPGFEAQIQASIAGTAGKPAGGGIGIFVDSAFMNWDGSSGPIDSIDLHDPQGGGHWLDVDYYYAHPVVGLTFGGPNSWGDSWPSKPMGYWASPFWQPGCYEITARCLQKVMSDCLLFSVVAL